MLWVIGGICLCVFLYPILQDLYLVYIRGIPPGPVSLPIIGGVYRLNPRVPHLSLESIGKQYGKIFSIKMGTFGRTVFLQDIKLVNQMFDCSDAHDRPDLPIFRIVNTGADGIGSCRYNSRWKTMTKILHRGLAHIPSSSIEESAIDAYLQLTDMFIQKQTCSIYYPRADVVKTCTAIISSLVYGVKTDNIDSPDLRSRIHYHSLLMSFLNPAHPFNLLPILWKLPTSIRKTLHQCISDRDELFDNSLKDHAENYNGEIKDVFDIIADYELKVKNHQNTSDDFERKDLFLSAWTIYMAGCDTTTDTSIWILLYLCVFPDVQEKMREEIDSVFTKEPKDILQQKQFLNYTRAAILECLRLSSPIAIGLPNVASRDLQIDGYTIPKGTALMANQWHIHHDETHWPEPFQLKPERFLDADGTIFSNYHIFQKMPFIPFSRGKRPCLGQTIALDLLLIYVTILLKKVEIQLPANYKPDLTGNVLFNLRPNEFPLECIAR
ncbi:cytochrome P450 2U1-like [Ruditapes philippinarum]|uniref:cytochrome P450 2U1-like n=1 Tax=Ruditapes philippinarum TaxID=129788 RepID=UPI00295AB660|nr:cytochrome P450 2U1-like [Ruditapes philippinarum]